MLHSNYIIIKVEIKRNNNQMQYQELFSKPKNAQLACFIRLMRCKIFSAIVYNLMAYIWGEMR